VIRKDGLNFVRLYFVNYTGYVNDLHNISNTTARALAECSSGAAVQQRHLRVKWLLCSTIFFAFVCKFIKTESPTAVQRAFRLRFNIQPPTRNSIYRWNHQFEKKKAVCVKAKAPAYHVYQRKT